MAAGAAGAAAAIANAIKASGAIVTVEPYDFEALVQRVEDPLVAHAEGGLFSTNYQYLMGYKGLATASTDRLRSTTATASTR